MLLKCIWFLGWQFGKEKPTKGLNSSPGKGNYLSAFLSSSLSKGEALWDSMLALSMLALLPLFMSCLGSHVIEVSWLPVTSRRHSFTEDFLVLRLLWTFFFPSELKVSCSFHSPVCLAIPLSSPSHCCDTFLLFWFL